jgi:hypothetical protein
MKTCLQCQQTKPLGNFYKQAKSPDGYQRYCKKCSNAFSALSEAKKKQKYDVIRKKARDKFADEVREYKVSRGCAHCGENHPAVLDLHHLDPTVKDLHPSDARGRRLFYEEAQKCIVLCSNCHRKVHYGV